MLLQLVGNEDVEDDGKKMKGSKALIYCFAELAVVYLLICRIDIVVPSVSG